MNVKELINVEPQMLAISPTHKCSASCENCCFACSPNISHIMDKEVVKSHINNSLSEFPSIKVLVITGGECFMLGDDLTDIIHYANTFNIVTRVVSNAFWATTYEIAFQRLKKLVDVGLTEINFSTGDNHLASVKIENIENAILASVALDINNICISIECHPDSYFSISDLLNNSRLKHLIDVNRIMIMNASWMKFKESSEPLNVNEVPLNVIDTKRPCRNLYMGININPYDQLLACCGLTVEYNKYLKLGDLKQNDIKTLYNNQFDDLFKFWLFVDGPEYIYEKVMDKRQIQKKYFPHECAYCIELIKDSDNSKYIKALLIDELPTIIYRCKINQN